VSVRLGVDLGGTKIAAVILGEDGGVLWEARVPTPQGDYDGIVRAVTDMVTQGETAVGATVSVGIGIPGAASRATGLVKNANSTCLIGRPFQADLSASLNRQVRLANDANCLAISEATDGAAAGASVVFGVILGTGTGGGLVIDGRVIEGANAIAGEWGHNPLPWSGDDERPGPACYCGRSGCIETWLSGPGLARSYAAAGGDAMRSEEVVVRANGGESLAEGVLGRWEERLARSLATVINVVDPDVIVVGGGLSAIERLYERVPSLWAPWVFSDTVRTRLRRAQYGDASGVRGAAWLWPR
jgi:fructokinase